MNEVKLVNTPEVKKQEQQDIVKKLHAEDLHAKANKTPEHKDHQHKM